MLQDIPTHVLVAALDDDLRAIDPLVRLLHQEPESGRGRDERDSSLEHLARLGVDAHEALLAGRDLLEAGLVELRLGDHPAGLRDRDDVLTLPDLGALLDRVT